MKLSIHICCDLILVSLFSINLSLQAQETTEENRLADKLLLGAYADVYYAFDFNDPAGWDRGMLANGNSHIFAHPTHNTFALNNAVLGMAYFDENVRSALSLHTGSYVRANYAAESTLSQLIYEAWVGVKIADNLWIDAGIFPSHIGAESAISMNNPTLTRSLMADNSPYFESGVKATWQPSEKISLTGLVLNGWQNIVENNDNKAIGTQITINPSNSWTLNSSTFFGKETPAYGVEPSRRYFHNLYLAYEQEFFSLLAAFDIGMQENLANDDFDIWYTPNIIARMSINPKFALAGRVEYYHDPEGIIVNPGTTAGFQTLGYSLNLDFTITENVQWRMEARVFDASDNVYADGSGTNNRNVFLISSLAITLGNYPF
ncbi:MAG: porin [Cyclobacteriaceae bacterium]